MNDSNAHDAAETSLHATAPNVGKVRGTPPDEYIANDQGGDITVSIKLSVPGQLPVFGVLKDLTRTLKLTFDDPLVLNQAHPVLITPGTVVQPVPLKAGVPDGKHKYTAEWVDGNEVGGMEAPEESADFLRRRPRIIVARTPLIES